MAVNIYFGAQYEYKQGVLHELIKRNIVDFALTDYYPYATDTEPEKDSRIVTIDHRPCADGEYYKMCNVEELPALSKQVMEMMLPYESMAIEICARNPYHIGDYYIAKREYYIHLRFWNYMFDHYKINFCFFNDLPHSGGKYVAYALAKAKGIPMLVLATAPPFHGRWVYGSDIQSIGIEIGAKYDELSRKGVNTYDFDDQFKSFLVQYSKSIEQIKSVNNPGKDNQTRIEYERKKKMVFDGWSGFSLSLKVLKTRLRYQKNRILAKKPDELIDNGIYKRHLEYVAHSIHFMQSRGVYTLLDYNKFAQNADYDRQYIYFGLQLTPEATTLPKAGVFSEQYNSIQLLAKAARRCGLMVYVKEHYVQVLRNKDFYDDLKKIDNVVLIKSSESTYDIINHSVGCATQTGSCIIEGVMMNKPVFVLGNGYSWKNMPGVFEIDNEEEGYAIIQSVLDGYKIDKKEVERYLYAIQLCTVKGPTRDYLRKYMNSEKGIGNAMDEVIGKVELLERYIKRSEINGVRGDYV